MVRLNLPRSSMPDAFRGMALDGEGNLYVAAETLNAGQDPDLTLLKYNAGGSLL